MSDLPGRVGYGRAAQFQDLVAPPAIQLNASHVPPLLGGAAL
jgi:hypothetical protein